MKRLPRQNTAGASSLWTADPFRLFSWFLAGKISGGFK
jgi:hypothetical protein